MLYKKISGNRSIERGGIEGAVLFFGILLILIVFLPRLLFPSRPATNPRPSIGPSPSISVFPSASPSPSFSASPSSSVSPSPAANLAPVCSGIEVLPSAQGRAPFKTVLVAHTQKTSFDLTGFRWDFNNDNIWDTQIRSVPQEYTFQTAGDYTVRLQVFDTKGNFSVCSTVVKVTQ